MKEETFGSERDDLEIILVDTPSSPVKQGVIDVTDSDTSTDQIEDIQQIT